MIIEALLSAIYNIMDFMLFFNIPKLPEQVEPYIDTMFDYLVAGAGILANYTPLDYLLILFSVLLAVDAAILIYHFVMWILKKIPMLSMS